MAINTKSRKHVKFEISGIYLFNKEGNMILNKEIPFNSELEEYIFGSTLMSIKIQIKNSLRELNKLKSYENYDFKVLVEEGSDFYLVVIGRGNAKESIRMEMITVVENLNKLNKKYFFKLNEQTNFQDTIKKEFGTFTKYFMENQEP